MSAAVIAAILAGTAAPLAVLAYAVRWRFRLLARHELALQREREVRRLARGRNRSRTKPVKGHTSLDWLRPTLEDREPTTPSEGGALLRHIDPVAYGPRRVCRACGHSNRIAAYYCARCSARLRR